MIKKNLIFVLVLCGIIYAQNNQSVELPNFVITGIRTIDIKTHKKQMPDLVSTLSKEFILSSKSPEAFKISIFSKISAPDTNIHISKRENNGFLNLGVGLNTIPVGDLRYTVSTRHVMLNARVFGRKDKDYETNSGYNVSGAEVNTDFFVSGGSNFFPGLRLGINAGFIRDDYKFFASPLPATQRKTKNFFGAVTMEKNLGGYNFGVELSGRMYELENINLEENVFGAKAFLEFNISRFAIKALAEYKKQDLTNNLALKDSYDYLAGKAFAKIDLSKDLSVKGGVSYSKADNENLFAPYASIKMKFSKSLSLFGEFNPGAEFQGVYDFVKLNRYYSLTPTDNIYTKYKIKINSTLKYEYEKYVEVGVSGGYSKADNYCYFTDTITPGFFNANTADDIEIMTGGIYAIFHLGPMGQLYGDLKISEAKFVNGNFVPYHSKIRAELNYSYLMRFGLEVNPHVYFSSGAYSDIANTNELDSFIDLGIEFKYSLLKNFYITAELNNILSNDNFYYKGYKEKPVDIILGIDYRW